MLLPPPRTLIGREFDLRISYKCFISFILQYLCVFALTPMVVNFSIDLLSSK